MKHRVLSFALVFALLVTLIPFGAVNASAASEFVASPELIELIKKWEGFSAKPFWDYGQWSVGYGTKAPDEHLERYRTEGISEEEATQLLTAYMESMGKSVNSFADKFGLTLTQGQFDAMLSLTYNCGSRWMLQVSTLRTAIVDGWTGSDFLFAFGQWSTAGGVTLPGLVRRRLAESNMYLNGAYSATVPADYCYVNLDANGGTCSVITQAYIAGEAVTIRAVPSYESYVFEGWYTDPTGGEQVQTLDDTVGGYTLYAHWSAGDGAGHPQDAPETEVVGSPVSYTREIASLTLNAFQQPVKGALVVDAFSQYELVDIVAEHTDSAGVKWGRVQNLGWINLTYTQEPSEEDQHDGVSVKVTGVDVNVRRGPGTAYAAVGKATVGDVIVISETSSGGGYVWGKFPKGWIALKYTNYDDAINEGMESDGSGQTPVMGSVNVNEFLRIRSGAGVGNSVVGTLGPKDRVEILEQKAVGGTLWARIEQGWISLDYVILDKESSQGPGETVPEQTQPEDIAPEETVPETTTPAQTDPPETKPEETIPEETAPQKPDASAVGKVKLTSGRLNIRTGPSTGYSVAGSYANGEAVTVLEKKTVGTVTWGRTDKGWISLDYVQLDQQVSEEKSEQTSSEQAQPEHNAVTGTVSLTSGCLRIRSGAGINNDIVGNLYNGAKVTITEQKSISGTLWGKTDKGWISLDYVKLSAETSASNPSAENITTPAEPQAESVTGIVKVNDFLRIRSGAGTSYSIVGFYYKNNSVTITQHKTVGGTKWGRTDRGWISLDYVVLDGQSAEESIKPESNGVSGTVTGTGLRIRSGAGTNHKIVGSLTIGDKVIILETTTVNGTQWGRIEKGWICMDYVRTN